MLLIVILYFVNSLKNFVRILLGIKCKLSILKKKKKKKIVKHFFFKDSFILDSLVFVLNNSLNEYL